MVAISWLTADHNKVETTQLQQIRILIENNFPRKTEGKVRRND